MFRGSESELKFVSNKKSARERAVNVLSEEIVEYLESQNIRFVERDAFDSLEYPPQVEAESEAKSDRPNY